MQNVQYDWVRVLNEQLENTHDQKCQCVQLIDSDFVANLRLVRNIDARNFLVQASQQVLLPVKAQVNVPRALQEIVE